MSNNRAINIGRVGSFPTSKYNSVGKHAQDISGHNLINTFLVSPDLEGDIISQDGIKDNISFNYFPRSEIKGNVIKKIILSIYWLYRIVLFQFKAIIFFRKKNIEILHIHSQLYTLVALWAKLTKKKTVITFHGEDFNNLKNLYILRKLLFCYDLICAISPSMIKKLELFSNKRVVYTPNSVNYKIFKNLNLKRENYIITVGSFKKVKRHTIILSAFKEFLKLEGFCNYKLKLIGDGNEKQNIKKFIKKNHIENIEFTGNITAKQLVSEYNKAKLLVLASEREGFPKVIIEGIACGIKIVTSKVGAIPEILGNDYSFYIKDISSKSLSKLFVDAINSNKIINYDLSSKYSKSNLQDKMYYLYKSLL